MDFALYQINPRYLKLLMQSDNKVMIQHGSHIRPYLGIILDMGASLYFVPISHSKRKYLFIRENIALVKLYDGQRLLSVLLLKCMIPVPRGQFKKINLNEIHDRQYVGLLKSEFRACKDKQQIIYRKAQRLRTLLCEQRKYHLHMLKYCCDFERLEKICRKYQKRRH